MRVHPHDTLHDDLLSDAMEYGEQVVCKRCLDQGQWYSISRTSCNINYTAPRPAGS